MVEHLLGLTVGRDRDLDHRDPGPLEPFDRLAGVFDGPGPVVVVGRGHTIGDDEHHDLLGFLGGLLQDLPPDRLEGDPVAILALTLT